MALIHWWPLNGDTKDYGLNCLNGSLIGSASYDNSGKIGKCLIADTGSLYSGRGVDIPSNLVDELSGKDYSFCAWVKVNGNHVHYEGAIISSGNWNNSCWAFGLNQNNTAINPAGNWYHTNYVSYTFEIGKWYHIVSVQKNGTNYVYVNGLLVGSVGHDPISQSDASDTCIGRETYAGGYFGFNGCINDVRIYDHALTPKQIKKLSQGLIIHYNPDHAIRSSCWTGGYDGDYGFSYAGGVSGMAQSDISDSSLPSGKYRKITWTATGKEGGPHTENHGQSIDGATYTTSFYWKSKGYKPSPNAENYTSKEVYTTLASNGWWYTQLIGKYNVSAKYPALTFYATPANGTACELDVSSIKIEPGDFATPYRRDNKSYIPDSSGFCHDGTIVSEAIEKSTDHKYKKNIIADGDPAHYIQSDINPSFLTSGVTFNVWYKNITNKTFLIANGQSTSYYVTAMNDTDKWCGNVSGATYYIDGEPRTTADGYPKDGQWHMYTSVHTSIGSWTALYWNRYTSVWAYNGPLGDIRLYATALSAADVKALYNETRVTHPMQFLVSNSSALSSLTSSNPVLADGELVVVRSTDSAGKTYFNIRKGNGVNNFNSLPWKQISETVLKGWRDSFSSDSTALTADTNSYTQLGK